MESILQQHKYLHYDIMAIKRIVKGVVMPIRVKDAAEILQISPGYCAKLVR